jgi:hypothetical protein
MASSPLVSQLSNGYLARIKETRIKNWQRNLLFFEISKNWNCYDRNYCDSEVLWFGTIGYLPCCEPKKILFGTEFSWWVVFLFVKTLLSSFKLTSIPLRQLTCSEVLGSDTMKHSSNLKHGKYVTSLVSFEMIFWFSFSWSHLNLSFLRW